MSAAAFQSRSAAHMQQQPGQRRGGRAAELVARSGLTASRAPRQAAVAGGQSIGPAGCRNEPSSAAAAAGTASAPAVPPALASRSLGPPLLIAPPLPPARPPRSSMAGGGPAGAAVRRAAAGGGAHGAAPAGRCSPSRGPFPASGQAQAAVQRRAGRCATYCAMNCALQVERACARGRTLGLPMALCRLGLPVAQPCPALRRRCAPALQPRWGWRTASTCRSRR